MKQTSIKVLRGRLEEAIHAHTVKIRNELNEARSARVKRNEAASIKVHAEITKAVEKKPSDYLEFTIAAPNTYNDGLGVCVQTTEKYDALIKALREKHGYDRSTDTAEGKTLVCFSLGIGDESRRSRWHNGVYVGTYDLFQPLLTKIDSEFLKSEPDQIAEIINSFIRTLNV